MLGRTLKVDERVARRMATALQRWTVSREGEDRTGARTKKWVRRLARGLEQHPAMRGLVFGSDEGVIQLVVELERRSNRHSAQVDAIERQHRALREGDDGDPDAYSQATAYMGREWWVRAVHARIIRWIDEYCLLTPEQMRRGHHPWAFRTGGLPEGWKRYRVGEQVRFWNPESKRMQLEAPPSASAAPPPPREPPVALLDVGSCSNPFLRWPYMVAPTAIDLVPSPDSEGVLEADFFEVPIVDAAAASPGQRLIMGDDGSVEGIVAGSFDVVVISLVLSYEPDPQRRIEMVSRARRCLREDRGLLFVVEVGSALAPTSWYQGDAAAEWSRSMEAAGFRLKKFEDTVEERYPYKQQVAYQWVLETAPVPDSEPLEPLRTSKELGGKSGASTGSSSPSGG